MTEGQKQVMLVRGISLVSFREYLRVHLTSKEFVDFFSGMPARDSEIILEPDKAKWYPFSLQYSLRKHIARWFKEKIADGRQQHGIGQFMLTWEEIKRIGRGGLENPVGIMSKLFRLPDQYIHPWQFGHPEQKKTCLWLHNLPPLWPTDVVKGKMMQLPRKDRERIFYMGSGNSKERSKTFQGIASAMAEQWGNVISAGLEGA